ncbi:hypothetical protein TNCV_4157671 [Trichonephila clavipes]|nr:hypothetical protein TNCV_4157671 [Trichonephila clavipes]
MTIKTKRRSCYFCGETQGVNVASLTSDDPTSRLTYNLREQGFRHMQPCFSAYRLPQKRSATAIRRTLQNSNKIVVGKKPQPIPAAEYVSTPSIAKKFAIAGGGATCGGCGMLPSRDDISRGEEPKRGAPNEEVKPVRRDSK